MHRSGYMAFKAPALLFANGIHPKFVQTLFVQANISVTMDLYSHWVPSIENQFVAAIEDAFRRTSKSQAGATRSVPRSLRGLRYGCSKLGWDVSRPLSLSSVFYLQMVTF